MGESVQHTLPGPEAGALADRAAKARAAIAANAHGYHTLELAPGILTEGKIDLRQTAAKILPDDLRGRRALDVGTFDGFWAFELEKRGAEVVAIDIEQSMRLSGRPPTGAAGARP